MKSKEEILQRLKEIGQNIIDQDNRITEQPIFLVQQKVKDYGYHEDWADEFDWIKEDGDPTTIEDPKLIRRLNNIWFNGDHTCLEGKYYPVYYKERWEYVSAFFTEKGCNDYLRIDRHNLSANVRTYADGSYRNNEFRDIRNFLIMLAKGEIKWDT